MRPSKKITSAALVVVILASICGYYFYSTYQDLTSEGYANAQLLVDDAWVLDHLDDQHVWIVDVRSRQDYAQGHIINAVNLEFENLRITVDGVRNVAPKAAVEAVFGELGLTPELTVVIYDQGDSLNAALVFWTLEYHGHRDVRILNGGWKHWIDNGNPATSETRLYQKTVYRAVIRPNLLATAQYILDNIENPEVVLVDARSHQEYEGVDVRAERGGHIPGAVNVEWMRNINPGGTFKLASELLEMYNDSGVTEDHEVITYCQSGHRAAHTYFTLRLLGYTVRMYDSSWEEWGSRPDLPVV